MKMSLSWHKDCLKNMQQGLLREIDNVRRANEQCDRLRQDIISYDAQIIEAETRNVDGFDREKFGKKQVPA